MARVAVVGVGAIGGALAGMLETAGGHRMSLCTRRPMPELTVQMAEETPRNKTQQIKMQKIKAQNWTAPSQAQPVDWVLVATKAYDAEATAQWLPRLCAEGAPVAVIQNGVEHRQRFAPYLGPERLLPVVIDCPVERTPDGVVLVRGPALMKVEDSSLGSGFAALFKGSNVAIELVDDFTTAVWWKLCVNSVGALSALALRPSGILRGQAMSQLALEMVAETVAVARAEGAHLNDSLCQEVLALYRKHPPDSVNSLLADRLTGRRTEWDARNAAIVRYGEKHRIPTPLNRMAATLLEAAEAKSL